jgi:hypothetical protein
VNRELAIAILKTILKECGPTLKIDFAILRKEKSSNDECEIVIKAILSKQDREQLKPILEKYGVKMQKQNDLWIFSSDPANPKILTEIAE